MRSSFKQLLLVLLLAFVTAAAFDAQTTTTGEIAGAVKDQSGATVPGAYVTLKSTDTGESRTAVATGSGEYRFSLLKPGHYALNAWLAVSNQTYRKS